MSNRHTILPASEQNQSLYPLIKERYIFNTFQHPKANPRNNIPKTIPTGKLNICGISNPVPKFIWMETIPKVRSSPATKAMTAQTNNPIIKTLNVGTINKMPNPFIILIIIFIFRSSLLLTVFRKKSPIPRNETGLLIRWRRKRSPYKLIGESFTVEITFES